MIGLVLLAGLAGCETSAAKALRTCEGGNTEACYRDGQAAMAAAKPQFSEARKLYAAACRPSTSSQPTNQPKHIPRACHELAILVRDAKGGPKDLPRAIEMFEIACKDGIARSCVDLATLLWSEDEARAQEAVRAVVLWGDACKEVDVNALPEAGPHDLAAACDGLGQAYEVGVGVEPPTPDEEKAATYYDKACNARYAPGCVSAGDLLTRRGKAELAAAASFYDRACRLDAREGCFELAQLHFAGGWEGARDEDAVAFYKKTCAIDPTRGCFEAAAMMEEGRVRAGEGEIESLYNQACDHGNTLACARRALKR
jgi:hypothetical protein